MTKDEALREAIDTLKSTKHGNCDFAWIDETLKKCTEALAQPVQEPAACRFCHSEKGCWTWQCYHCGEIDDVQQPAAPLPVQPEQDFKTATKEDAALKQVIDLIQPVAALADSTPFEHSEVIQRCVDAVEIALEALAQPPLPVQPVQEPVTWDKPSASFNAWWDSDRRRDTANPFTTDSFAYWAFEGWQAALAQRPWVGLTDEEIFHAGPRIGTSDSNVNPYQILINARAIEAKLKEKNT